MNIVKELRVKKGIRQNELASIIGVSQPAVSDWEKGKKDPTGSRLAKLAEYFNVDTLTILGLKPHEPVDTTPQEIRIVSGAMEKMSKEQQDQVVAVVRAMFSNRPELFN